MLIGACNPTLCPNHGVQGTADGPPAKRRAMDSDSLWSTHNSTLVNKVSRASGGSEPYRMPRRPLQFVVCRVSNKAVYGTMYSNKASHETVD